MIDTLLHAHHIVPVACGGADSPDNLILVCPTCHALAHYMGRMHRVEKGKPSIWCGPQNRDEFLFCFAMLKNREEYPRFAALGHRRDAYLDLLHDEATEQEAVEDVKRNRRFTLVRGVAS